MIVLRGTCRQEPTDTLYGTLYMVCCIMLRVKKYCMPDVVNSFKGLMRQTNDLLQKCSEITERVVQSMMRGIKITGIKTQLMRVIIYDYWSKEVLFIH